MAGDEKGWGVCEPGCGLHHSENAKKINGDQTEGPISGDRSHQRLEYKRKLMKPQNHKQKEKYVTQNVPNFFTIKTSLLTNVKRQQNDHGDAS